MRFFVSYSRRDLARINPIAKRLNRLGHETWMDDRLTGGQAWWDEILANIRGADALLFGVSESSLDSEACTLERAYATSLGKPVLPVALEAFQSQLLPPDLAALQFVDYSTPGEDAVTELAGALNRMPTAPALPDPLPAPPPIPVSYLSDLSQKVGAPSLSLEEQRLLVMGLEEALRRSSVQKDPEDHEATLDLLRKLEQRPDLYMETGRRITAVMAGEASAMPTASPPDPAPSPPAPPPSSPVSPVATGWVAPSGPTPVATGWVAPSGPTPPAATAAGRKGTPKWIIALAVIGAIVVLGTAITLFAGPTSVGETTPVDVPQTHCAFVPEAGGNFLVNEDNITVDVFGNPTGDFAALISCR